MTDERAKKLEELANIIKERVNKPGMNPDFDGIFSRIIKRKYIPYGNFTPFDQKEQTEEEKKKNAIGKFVNYAFYELMKGEYKLHVNTNNFDEFLKQRINANSYGIRKYLENNLRKIKEDYGYAISIGELGDTSETDWYKAQDDISDSIMDHFADIYPKDKKYNKLII